jgi:hypothetical protein
VKLCTFADGSTVYVGDGEACPIYNPAYSPLASEGFTIEVDANGAKWPAWLWLLILAAMAYEKYRRS